MIDEATLQQGVTACVALALDIPADGIRPEHTLVGDLGADSLDILDLVFQLEQRFKVRIAPGDIERRLAARLGGPPADEDGVYYAQALVELRNLMPEAPAEELSEGLTRSQLPTCFRVRTMMNLVARLAAEQPLGATEGEPDG